MEPARINVPEIEDDQYLGLTAEYWVPRCSVPDCLWDVYAQTGASKAILESTFEAALHDITALRLPPGLSREHFYAYVAMAMRRMPLIAAIDNRTSAGLSDTEAEELLEDYTVKGSYYAPNEMWEILKSWLMHFMESSYRVESREDVLVRGQRLTDEGL